MSQNIPERRCENWLATLAAYAEDTESPRRFWLWAGIFTITAAVQRQVWLPYGMEPLYANLYVMIVAPPGRFRKSVPVSFAKKILTDLQVPVYVDSPTKRALTMALEKSGKENHFTHNTVYHNQCAYALISKELSSFFAVDPKAMVEVLTDLFDSHAEWKYETSGKGSDSLRNVCLNCLLASTPTWIANNLPADAIGGGFTSRFVLVAETEKYKSVPRPAPPNEQLYNDLRADLAKISKIVGEFSWGPGAGEYFDEWYDALEKKVHVTKDRRLHGYIERMHIIAIKTAMALRLAYSHELVITISDIAQAAELIDDVLNTASTALGAHGRSTQSLSTFEIMQQVKALGRTTFKDLLKTNFFNTTKYELEQIVETLSAMGHIKSSYNPNTAITEITWIAEKGKRLV